MNDIIKSIKAFLYDRSASPLFGAFIISLLAWNHRAVMVVFSGSTAGAKFRLMDKLLETQLWGQEVDWFPIVIKLINVIVMPAIITTAYLWLYPKIAKPVYEHSLKNQKEIRELKQAASDARLLDAEESQELYRQLAELQDKLNRATENHQKQATSLLNKISELEKESSVSASASSGETANVVVKNVADTLTVQSSDSETGKTELSNDEQLLSVSESLELRKKMQALEDEKNVISSRLQEEHNKNDRIIREMLNEQQTKRETSSGLVSKGYGTVNPPASGFPLSEAALAILSKFALDEGDSAYKVGEISKAFGIDFAAAHKATRSLYDWGYLLSSIEPEQSKEETSYSLTDEGLEYVKGNFDPGEYIKHYLTGKNRDNPDEDTTESPKKYVDMSADFELSTASQIQKHLDEMPSQVLQKYLDELPEKKLARLFDEMPKNKVGKLIDETPEHKVFRTIDTMPAEKLNNLLNKLSEDELKRLISKLPIDELERLAAKLPKHNLEAFIKERKGELSLADLLCNQLRRLGDK